MAANWTIGSSTPAELNISGLELNFRSRAADEARFSQDGAAYDGAASFSYGQTYNIYKDAVRMFSGRCITIPRQGTGLAESISYTLSGGWHWLEQIMYQQTWKVGAGNTSKSKTRVILGYDDNGLEINANKQIQNIIQFARLAGATLAIGTIDVSTQILPSDEQVDITCAAALNRVLAWFPDTAVWVDYSALTPTINFVRRAKLTPVTVLTAYSADEVSITPRYDIQVPGVRIIYEIVSESGNDKVMNVVEDVAGDVNALGAMTYTIQVGGGYVKYLWQSIKVDTHTPAILTSADARVWWAKKIPHLDGWKDVTLHDAEPTPWPPTHEMRKCTNELLEGEIQPWMRHKGLRVTAKVKADYTLNGKEVVNQLLAYSMTITSANTGFYNALDDLQYADKVHLGLAADVFEALSSLYYEGRVVLLAEDPPASVKIGNVLNLSGGMSEWVTMKACVQEVSMRLETGQTTITFGPPEHLGVMDRIQFAKANRDRTSMTSLAAKTSSNVGTLEETTGGPDAGNNSTGGGEQIVRVNLFTPDKSSTNVIVDGEAGKVSATNGSVTLTIDPSATSEDITVITGITPEFDYVAKPGGGALRLKLTIKKKTLRKVSNAWVSISTETTDILPHEDIDVYTADVVSGIEVDHSSLLISNWRVSSFLEDGGVEEPTRIEGVECDGH